MATALRQGLGGLFTALAVGCGQPAPPALMGGNPVGMTGHAPPGDPATPPPAVTWAHHAIATTGLPAIARDGSSIVVAHRDSDGGRGNPNITLIEKARDDRELARFVVVTADDVDRLDPHELELRFTRAGEWLAQRQTAGHLVAMTALATRPPTDDAPAQAVGAGITLRWAPDQLVLERPGSAPLSRATPASWLAVDYPLCQTCSEVCHNEAFLGGGYADVARSAAVIVVAYRGSDTCWEPGSQEHIVVW